MRRLSRPFAAAFVVAASMMASVPMARAFDFGVHLVPGNPFYTCLSYDGRVVGTGYDLYTQDGVIDIVRTGYYNTPLIRSINDDGTIFGGMFQGGAVGGQGVIDRGPDDYTIIGQSFQQNFIEVTHLSGDGSVGLVNHQSASYHNAYVVLWDGTRIQDALPAGFGETYGNDLSRDGRFAVGSSYLIEGGTAAYRQEIGVGYEVLNFPGSTRTSVSSISADGSIVAGRYDNQRAYRMVDGVYAELAFDPVLYASSSVGEMNDDGTVLIGQLGLAGTTPSQSVSAIWFEAQGWVLTEEYFASFGIVMPQGRTIDTLLELSSDGQTFLGRFDNDQYFVVTVPGPGSLALLGFGVFAARRKR